MRLPWHSGPVTDTTGASCGMGQDGPVWFLAGHPFGASAVTRECTIPNGKQLYFPLANMWWVEFDWGQEPPAALEWVVHYFEILRNNPCNLTLRLDGEDVIPGSPGAIVETQWVGSYEPFDVYLNPDNWSDPSDGLSGEMTTVGGGYYARMHPLTPGDHLLELGGGLCFEGVTWFEVSATYHLHIGA